MRWSMRLRRIEYEYYGCLGARHLRVSTAESTVRIASDVELDVLQLGSQQRIMAYKQLMASKKPDSHSTPRDSTPACYSYPLSLPSWDLSVRPQMPMISHSNPSVLRCDALLAAGLGEKVVLPADPAFEISISHYWALNPRIRPWCIFQPRTTEDISNAVKILANAIPTKESGGIAIRSGGHAAADYANGIVNGVTFDLGMMNYTSYDASTTVASIQSGARWGNVYSALTSHNVTVSGGRDAQVGVGGLLLSGGISHYANRVGLSCDTIVNYEIVLANGTITHANETHHADLWKALKGGFNNFGIVTRFDKSTISGQDIAFSERTISSNYSDEYIDALVKFTSAANTRDGDAIIGFYRHAPTSPEIFISLFEFNTYGTPNSTAFDLFNRIPADISAEKIQTLAEAATAYPGGERSGAGSSLTLANDARVLRRAVRYFKEHVSYLSSRLGAENFTSSCFFEPIPASVQRFGSEKGGNMLGLPVAQDVMIWDIWTSTTGNDADLAIVHAALRRLSAQITHYAKSVDRNVETIYGAYADASQDVVGSYPAENQRFMSLVAEAYDPKGFFRERVTGGFKIPPLRRVKGQVKLRKQKSLKQHNGVFLERIRLFQPRICPLPFILGCSVFLAYRVACHTSPGSIDYGHDVVILNRDASFRLLQLSRLRKSLILRTIWTLNAICFNAAETKGMVMSSSDISSVQ
nr:fad-dependent monooxygenase yanf [Quercus suber]